MGVLKLLTGGCFGVLWLIDTINITTGKLRPTDGSDYEEDLAINPSQTTTQPSSQSLADELKKYKELYDQGVITEEV